MNTILAYMRRAAWLPIMHLRDALGPARPVVLVSPNEDGSLTLANVNGPIVTDVYAPQRVTVSSVPTVLDPPALASQATVHVLSGAIQRAIGGTLDAAGPVLRENDYEKISGLEIPHYLMVRDGAVDAVVLIEYRAEG